MWKLPKVKKQIESIESLHLKHGNSRLTSEIAFFLQIHIKKLFWSSNFAYTIDLQVWIHKPYWKRNEHKSNNSEKQKTENGAFLQTHTKKRSFS